MIEKIESYYVENLWRHKQTENMFCFEDDVRKLESYCKQQAEEIKELKKELKLYKGMVV